ncbi:hypothetical protein [Pelotalea chapellei]|uniref:Uncharacterized protein n=1 Tax=Pelotalea chapellei TaxID=44671 RepID=A0ABS5U5Q4_9BACT|nr:hypothetical protein [Pelotalea chapellei]MBT1070991.1 hypothetical protein [Pelotalea chapellei]
MHIEKNGIRYFRLPDGDLLPTDRDGEQVLFVAENGNEEVRLIRKLFRGIPYLDLRKFRGTGEDAKPTTKGFIADFDVWEQLAPIISKIFEKE